MRLLKLIVSFSILQFFFMNLSKKNLVSHGGDNSFIKLTNQDFMQNAFMNRRLISRLFVT